MINIVLETKSIGMNYGKVTALSNVSIKLRRGEIYGLVGDNGAGKSTLLKILTGQIFATSGEIILFGESSQSNLEHQRKRTGAIIENPGFFPHLSVENNLEYYRIQKGVTNKNIIMELLETVNLYDDRKKKCSTLSMGMKQRLGLAISLIGDPEILVLDEPINGLDPSGIVEMRNLLLCLSKKRGISIIISSHILSELEHITDVYGFLDKGKLLEQITANQLLEYLQASSMTLEDYFMKLKKGVKAT